MHTGNRRVQGKTQLTVDQSVGQVTCSTLRPQSSQIGTSLQRSNRPRTSSHYILTIGMEDRARLGMLAKPRHRERVQYQVHRHPRFERPADDSSSI